MRAPSPSRSPKISTPNSTFTRGLMKYPSDASTTWLELTAQMNTSQFSPTRKAAATMRGSRSRVSADLSQPHGWRSSTRASATATSDQMMRWARISNAPAGFSSGNSSGKKPQMT